MSGTQQNSHPPHQEEATTTTTTSPPPTKHRFVLSSELKRTVEAARFEGHWNGNAGRRSASSSEENIVQGNMDIIKRGGFTLRGKKSKKPTNDEKINDDDGDDHRDDDFQPVPAPAVPIAITVSPSSPEPLEEARRRFPVTEFCVANADTLSAALAVGNASALNFANAETPGGRYRMGGLAQEEDLCRSLPQLYASLARGATEQKQYPIQPGTALLSGDLFAVRAPGTYALQKSAGSVSIITAAMPCGIGDRRPPGGWLGPQSKWAETVRLRIRSVLRAAVESGKDNVVLGAFGCGAFGNPARPTAQVFTELLKSAEFAGAFHKVVFAIIDPMGTGNLKPFVEELKVLSSA